MHQLIEFMAQPNSYEQHHHPLRDKTRIAQCVLWLWCTHNQIPKKLFRRGVVYCFIPYFRFPKLWEGGAN